MKERGVTCLEVLVICMLIFVLGAILVPTLTSTREAPRRASCSNNLKQIGLSLRMYSNEMRGEKYPPLGIYYQPSVDCDSENFELDGKKHLTVTNAMNIQSVYPEYIDDPAIFSCPSDPTNRYQDGEASGLHVAQEFGQVCSQDDRGVRTAGDSYTYLSHYVGRAGDGPMIALSKVGDGTIPEWESDEEIPLGLAFYAHLIDSLKDEPDELIRVMDEDFGIGEEFAFLDGTETSEDDLAKVQVYRLREGVERFLITDIANNDPAVRMEAEIPVMFDNPDTIPSEFNHVPGGSNVLYLDGHVAFVKYEEGLVTSPAFAKVMRGLYPDMDPKRNADSY